MFFIWYKTQTYIPETIKPTYDEISKVHTKILHDDQYYNSAVISYIIKFYNEYYVYLENELKKTIEYFKVNFISDINKKNIND